MDMEVYKDLQLKTLATERFENISFHGCSLEIDRTTFVDCTFFECTIVSSESAFFLRCQFASPTLVLFINRTIFTETEDLSQTKRAHFAVKGNPFYFERNVEGYSTMLSGNNGTIQTVDPGFLEHELKQSGTPLEEYLAKKNKSP